MPVRHENEWMRPVGGMIGGLIGSIWGPIGGFAGSQAGQDVGAFLGDAIAGNWAGVGDSLGQQLRRGLDPLGSMMGGGDLPGMDGGQMQGQLPGMGRMLPIIGQLKKSGGPRGGLF